MILPPRSERRPGRGGGRPGRSSGARRRSCPEAIARRSPAAIAAPPLRIFGKGGLERLAREVRPELLAEDQFRVRGLPQQVVREPLLYAPEMHDPDLIIRTSGEQRLSNYLLWQSAYSELVFRDELWPDFTREAFEASLAEYAERRRRYGGR